MPKSPQDEVDIRLTPIGFTETVLGLKGLYPWQDRVLTSFEGSTGPNAKQKQVALVSPNGAGKSANIVAPIALWWIFAHERGKVVITTKDGKQLHEQIYPALSRHKDKFEGWEWKISPYIRVTTPTGGTLIAFTTDEAERVEGNHKTDDVKGPLLMIVDEAKGVDDKIFQGVDRCTFNAQLYASSPGMTRGRFYDAFHKDRALFKCFQVGLNDCPHIPKEKIERIIATHGDDHPFTRSTIYGEFMAAEDLEKYCISDMALQFCLQNPPPHRKGIRAMFCDFAGAGAENVAAFRDGNKIEIAAAWREANKLASCSRFVQLFRHYDLKESEITGDAADKEMCDLLKEAGWHIKRQNFGAPAWDAEVYSSWGAEAWNEGGMAIQKGEFILPHDDDLIAQLTTRRRTFGRAGKMGMEEKYIMRTKRNLPSPDRADAVLGVMAQREYKQPKQFKTYQELEREFDTSTANEVLEKMGAFC
jgi:phage terminase large subunit